MRLNDFSSYGDYSSVYAELVQLCQEKKINLVEFIKRQEELFELFKDFLFDNKLQMNEESASKFLDYVDNL